VLLRATADKQTTLMAGTLGLIAMKHPAQKNKQND